MYPSLSALIRWLLRVHCPARHHSHLCSAFWERDRYAHRVLTSGPSYGPGRTTLAHSVAQIAFLCGELNLILLYYVSAGVKMAFGCEVGTRWPWRAQRQLGAMSPPWRDSESSELLVRWETLAVLVLGQVCY